MHPTKVPTELMVELACDADRIQPERFDITVEVGNGLVWISDLQYTTVNTALAMKELDEVLNEYAFDLQKEADELADELEALETLQTNLDY